MSTPEPKAATHVAELAAAHQLGEGSPHSNDLRRGQQDAPIYRLDRIDRGGDLESVDRLVACLDKRSAARETRPGPRDITAP